MALIRPYRAEDEEACLHIVSSLFQLLESASGMTIDAYVHGGSSVRRQHRTYGLTQTQMSYTLGRSCGADRTLL